MFGSITATVRLVPRLLLPPRSYTDRGISSGLGADLVAALSMRTAAAGFATANVGQTRTGWRWEFCTSCPVMKTRCSLAKLHVMQYVWRQETVKAFGRLPSGHSMGPVGQFER